MAEPRRAAPILEVRGLNVYYGSSHALQGVDLTLDVGRAVGRRPQRHGQDHAVQDHHGPGARLRRLDRACAAKICWRCSRPQIARLGVGYVPQGRRLWRSLTVDEHLRMIAGLRRGAWTVERIYDTFPRLAERKSNGGGQLSGGEQQMLAISRALLTNPRLLIMDEPTEGLAPVIVAQVEDMLVRLGEEGDIAILVIEQNIGVATGGLEHVAIMVNGRDQSHHRVARVLAADRDLQQRLLGVGRHGDAEPETDADATRRGGAPRGAARQAARRSGSMSPTRRRRRAGRSPCRSRGSRRPRARCRAACRGAATRRGRAATPRAAPRRPAGRARRRHARHQGRGTALHPRPHRRAAACARGSSMSRPAASSLRRRRPGRRRSRSTIRAAAAAVFAGDRGTSVDGDGRGLRAWIAPADATSPASSRAGGSGGASLVAPAMRALPIGVPKMHGLVGRLGRRRPLCRPDRHHDDVFGHRRAGPERDLAAGARQRRARDGRHGQGAARARATTAREATRACPRSA